MTCGWPCVCGGGHFDHCRYLRGGYLITAGFTEGSMGQNVSQVNVRQANGIGKVHAAKPQMKETYCGRPLNEEEWLVTSKEVTCIGCVRAGSVECRK
jgi:hypothetical protein